MKAIKKLSFSFQVDYGTLRTVISVICSTKETLNGVNNPIHQASGIRHHPQRGNSKG